MERRLGCKGGCPVAAAIVDDEQLLWDYSTAIHLEGWLTMATTGVWITWDGRDLPTVPDESNEERLGQGHPIEVALGSAQLSERSPCIVQSPERHTPFSAAPGEARCSNNGLNARRIFTGMSYLANRGSHPRGSEVCSTPGCWIRAIGRVILDDNLLRLEGARGKIWPICIKFSRPAILSRRTSNCGGWRGMTRSGRSLREGSLCET
jgi:hypothetical protein